MRAALTLLLLPAILVLPGPGASQPGPVTRPAPPLRPTPVGPRDEIIIYRDRNFDGPAVAIPQDEPNLRLVWTVSSARVQRGTWQLCERPNFRGSCLTLSSSNRNLGARRVQSARSIRRQAAWGVLGEVEVSRFGWDRRVVRVRGDPSVSEVRLCAERNRVRIRNVRAFFAERRYQTLHVPSQLASGRCSNVVRLARAPRNLSSVEMSVSTTALAARGRIRVEGR